MSCRVLPCLGFLLNVDSDCLHFQNSRCDLGAVCRVHKICQTFERAMKIGSVVMSRIVKDEIFGQILVAGRAFGVGSDSLGSPSTRGIIITTTTTAKASALIILTSIPLIHEFFGVGLFFYDGLHIWIILNRQRILRWQELSQRQ